MDIKPLKLPVANRGTPPDDFLTELVTWGKKTDEVIFSPNNDKEDVFIRLLPVLGPWRSPLHRRAALLELLRVVAGFESSWKWNCGVDTTNHTSMTHLTGQETGIFQVSYDSLNLDDAKNTGDDLRQCVIKFCGDDKIENFIPMMKKNHPFALEYGATLFRNNFYWDGPVKRHEVDRWLARNAVNHFQLLLSE